MKSGLSMSSPSAMKATLTPAPVKPSEAAVCAPGTCELAWMSESASGLSCGSLGEEEHSAPVPAVSRGRAEWAPTAFVERRASTSAPGPVALGVAVAVPVAELALGGEIGTSWLGTTD
jgi:hypothetical protein